MTPKRWKEIVIAHVLPLVGRICPGTRIDEFKITVREHVDNHGDEICKVTLNFRDGEFYHAFGIHDATYLNQMFFTGQTDFPGRSGLTGDDLMEILAKHFVFHIRRDITGGEESREFE